MCRRVSKGASSEGLAGDRDSEDVGRIDFREAKGKREGC